VICTTVSVIFAVRRIELFLFVTCVDFGEPSNFITISYYLIRKVNTGTPYSYMIEPVWRLIFADTVEIFFVCVFCVLECVGHSPANVAH
jgi:hypothetical protein